MAGKDATLKFLIYGEDKTASKAIKGVGDESDKTHGKLGKLGGMAGGALATGVGAAAVAAGALGYALVDAAKGAMEDEKAAARLASQLKNTTGASAKQVAAVEDYITKAGIATGIADDQMRPAFQRLAASTKDIGEAQDLTNLAMDISAGTGKDLTTVSFALAKANDGQVDALKKLGISLGDQAQNFKTYQQQAKAVAKAQETYNLAVDDYGPKSKQALAAAAKLEEKQAALNTTQSAGIDVMGELGKQFQGGAATAADTLAGRVGRLKLQFDEAKETVGAKLLPVVERLVAWFQDKAMPVIGEMAQQLMPKLREVFDAVKQSIEDNRPGLEKLATAMGAVAKVVVEKVLPVLMDLWKVQLKTVIKVLGELGEALPPIAAAWLRYASTAVKALGNTLTAAMEAFDGILTAAEKGMGWIPGIGGKIKEAKSAFDDFKAHTTEKLSDVSAALATAADKVDGWNTKARGAEEAKIKADIDDLKTKIATAKEKLNDPDLTKDRKAELKADIADLKAKVADAKEELVSVKDRTVTVTVNLKANQVKARARGSGEEDGSGGDGGPPSSSSPVGHGLMAATRGVGHPGARFMQRGSAWSWGRVNGMGMHDGADISTGAGTPVYATRSGVASRNSGGWAGNNVVLHAGGTKFIFAHLSRFGKTGQVNAGDVIGYVGWSGHVLPKGPRGAHLHIQASRNGRYVNPANYLANGGIVKANPGGTVVVAGEAGRDEAVVPLPRGWRGDGGMGDTYNITVTGGLGDREAVARDVKLALLELKRRSGGAALGIA